MAMTDGSGRRVTLTEVAKRAGVSRAAASFALNGRLDQRLSEETMARVRQAADDPADVTRGALTMMESRRQLAEVVRVRAEAGERIMYLDLATASL